MICYVDLFWFTLLDIHVVNFMPYDYYKGAKLDLKMHSVLAFWVWGTELILQIHSEFPDCVKSLSFLF